MPSRSSGRLGLGLRGAILAEVPRRAGERSLETTATCARRPEVKISRVRRTVLHRPIFRRITVHPSAKRSVDAVIATGVYASSCCRTQRRVAAADPGRSELHTPTNGCGRQRRGRASRRRELAHDRGVAAAGRHSFGADPPCPPTMLMQRRADDTLPSDDPLVGVPRPGGVRRCRATTGWSAPGLRRSRRMPPVHRHHRRRSPPVGPRCRWAPTRPSSTAPGRWPRSTPGCSRPRRCWRWPGPSRRSSGRPPTSR